MAANPAPAERAFGVTNIKTHIPIKLDLADHNYDAWRELLQTHCLAFDVLGHIDGTSTPADANDAAWQKRDSLVKLWLYGTLAEKMFRSSFKPGGTARDIWLRIENQFRNNKEARVLQVDTDLRSLEIGDLTILDYCQKLKSYSDLLTNLDAPVADRTLVMYMLNGLNDRFDNIINVIKHREPFPTFDAAQSMLEMEEKRILKFNKTSATHKDNASSSTILTVSDESQQPPRPQQQRQNNNSYNNHRGGRRGNRGRGRYNNNRNYYNNWPPGQYWQSPPMQWQQRYPYWGPFPQQPQPVNNVSPRPPPQANIALAQLQPTTDFAHAFNTMTLADPSAGDWYMDSGATSHLAADPGILKSCLNKNIDHSVVVGNGSQIPVLASGNSSIHTSSRPLSLNRILIAPDIVKNLISVRKFTRDNFCSVEFDPFGFSVKDLQTQAVLMRSNSSGDLYSLPSSHSKPSPPSSALLSISPDLWHKRLAHINKNSLNSLISANAFACNNDKLATSCKACQLGKQIKLPFRDSNSYALKPFELIHSDVWTSPISSPSNIRYYVLFLDDHTHFVWVYPLRRKSEVFSKFKHFSNYVENHFQAHIQDVQCDNGGEYDNHQFHDFCDNKGITMRFSCPHTSQQNGKSERMIRTINNAIRSLLFQAHMSPVYWVEALHVAVHILNILPSVAIHSQIPFTLLFQKAPTYDHLKVFGSLCFPNLNYSHLHKLAPRSTPCLFLGYPSNHKGFRCMDLKTNRIIISRHVYFDESVFPAAIEKGSPATYNFLGADDEPSQIFKNILQGPISSPISSVPPLSNTAPSTSTSASSATTQVQAHVPHKMQTRSQTGVSKPKKQFSLLSTVSPLPTSYLNALKDPNWTPSMTDEMDAFDKAETWDLVPRPANTNVVRCMWLYKHKLDADGVPRRHKSRLVANGKSQEEGVDYNDTFAPVVKPATIRAVLDVSLARNWPIHQLDVKNAFLHGELEETIYMQQPPGFIDDKFPSHVCKLKKAIYGLKQAPRAWNSRFANFVKSIGFKRSDTDTSLFTYNNGSRMAYLLLYVDDIILTASDDTFLRFIVTTLQKEFPMSDSGKLHYFLGVKAEFKNGGIFLSQQSYAEDIIQRSGMVDCKPCSTPVDLQSKLSLEDGELIADATQYRRLAGALQYLTFTRPDISYAVHQICLYMHSPRVPHLQALKRIIRYVKGTKAHGLQLRKSNITDLVAYSDADWGGCPDTRRSTSGYCVFLGSNLVSWSAKRQPTVSRSSAEAEYKGVANAVAELCWIRNLLLDLGCPITKAALVYCDNISAVYLSQNPVKHQRTKHIEIDIHFVREKVTMGQVRVLHVPSSHQYADIFTKGLPTSLFNEFRSSLTVLDPDNVTEGG